MNLRISAMIPTWRRPESLVRALNAIVNCRPAPDEVLVHVDAGDDETKKSVGARYGGLVRWLSSECTQGPGGGRNKLIRECKAELVASFDDDSWPIDTNYFAVASRLFALHADVAVLVGQEVRPGQTAGNRDSGVREVSCYQGCASVIRRDAFLGTRGHLPLRHAYGMEEADVALQLLDAGWRIFAASDLRVLHDSGLDHHSNRAVNAAHIRNTALLAYLRYPMLYWPLGALQTFNRVAYAARVGRWRGIGEGLAHIPGAIWKYRKERMPVRAQTIRLSRHLAHGIIRPR